MSLINDMLRDLDRRSAQGAPDRNNPAATQVAPAPAAASGNRVRRLIAIGCLLGLLLLVGMGYRIYSEYQPPNNPQLELYQPVVQPVEPGLADSRQEEIATPVDIEQVNVTEIAEGARIEVQLSGRVDHRVVLAGERQLEIHLPQTRLTQRLEPLVEKGLLQAIDVAAQADTLVLRVFLREVVSFQSYLLNQDDRISLVVDLIRLSPGGAIGNEILSLAGAESIPPALEVAPQQTQILPPSRRSQGMDESSAGLVAIFPEQGVTRVEPKPAGGFSKQARVPSPAERDRSSADRALVLIRANQSAQAISELTVLLDELPQARASRELLATLLLEQKRYGEAAPLISTGLRLEPQNINLIKLQSRLFMSGADPHQALELLEANKGAASTDLEYLSLLAYLYQNNNAHARALESYAALARMAPNEPRWWVGQGVSLEALGQPEDALRVFMQAQRIPQADGRLKDYINGRIAALN